MMEITIILIASFLAGILNTIAGGGTFLTFPALVFIGVPPVMANATSAVAVFPGYLGGALGFRDELGKLDRKQIIRLIIITLVGGLIGSLLLLISSNKAFSLIVPFLLFGATLAFLYGEKIRNWAAKKDKAVTPFGAAGLLLASIYGGYFNGGLGIVLLALFALWGMTNIHEMNGLKSGLSFVLSAISVVVFAIGGLIDWHYALAMMLASTLGGYAGAPIARALPKKIVRMIIAIVGFTMSAVFFYRLF
ncbi:sulfite exporter TauE/SafE family protein [Ahrensia sp. 13_GOM-1096m]|uniref:sulfite exporter TauE/SafE family protein n=1 Tax=Ahrensia sp. 13_GOM-1096m TaxID=1380380 RepID=UPI00047C7C94|nr:sulfite exporter TauE/SafE family protein [Ahrensia sp. 13_GOM-1096m]